MSEQTKTHLVHKATMRLPRHLQSHSHIASLGAKPVDEPASPSYPTCCMVGAKNETLPTDAKPLSKVDQMLQDREALCESWITNYANSINQQHYVTAEFVTKTFGPTDKDSVGAIFARFAGSPK